MNIQKLDKPNIQDILGLTPMQEGMLFYYLSNSESKQYLEQLCLTLCGEIDENIIKKAWNHVAKNNEMLRTIFKWDKLDKPLQIILKQYDTPYVQYDLSNINSTDKAMQIMDIKNNELNEKIDLSENPLKIAIVKLDSSKFELVITYHHILYDGWSNGILLKEFMQSCNNLCANKPLSIVKKNNFKEFIKHCQKQDKAKQEAFWSEHFSDYDIKSTIGAKTSYSEACLVNSKMSYKFSEKISEDIYEFCKKQKTTVAALIYTAWGLLLQKYNNTNDIVFGTTVSGRNADIVGIEDMVGLFINTLPLRVNSTENNSIQSLLKMVDNILKERDEYQSTPLVDIKSYSGIDSKEELFDTLVVIENYPLDQVLISNDNYIKIEEYSMTEMTNYKLTLEIIDFKGLELQLSYDASIFDYNEINRMARHFENIIINIIKNSACDISKIDMLTKEERQQILTDFNDTKADYPKDKTIHKLFEEQVEKTPDSIAIVFEDKILTYRELNERTNQLARVLRDKGVVPDSIVGIMVERSIEMIVGIIGILKAGGAYLPIDTEYPQDRIEYITKDSKCSLLLTQKKLIEKVPPNIQALILEDDSLYVGDCSNSNSSAGPNNLAYIIYTSGSTGTPKGVMLEHSGVVNTLHVLKDKYPIKDNDAYLLKTSYTFDVSVSELFGWFMGGGRLVILKHGGEKEPMEIFRAVRKYQVTHLNFVPSMLRIFVQILEDSSEKPDTLKYVFSAGEALSIELAERFRYILPNISLENLYGPTETTIYATKYSLSELNDNMTIAIGKPIYNTTAYIVDSNFRLQPIGVAGELCLGGAGLARGYVNRPELTAEKFVNNPFEPTTKMYKTGDLARWLPDGNIEFLGRIDHQVKIRGYRIELGEIDSKLLSHEAIKDTVVIAKDDNNGNKYLCAYIVMDYKLTIAELREYLLRALPDYMIPSYFIPLEKLPLTSNGKVDRKALSELDYNISTGVEYEAPRNSIEEKLVEIWREILGVEKIGINDNFFELGGHSLKATSLASKIHKVLNVEVPLRDILTYPTIKEISEYIKGSKESIYASIEKVEEKDYYDMSSAQKRIYTLQQLEHNNISYNMSRVLELEGDLDIERLKGAFNKLIQRHETLRTSFEVVEDVFVQKVDNEVEFEIEQYKVESEEKIKDIVKSFIRAFDLSKAPLMRVGLVKVHPSKYILMFDMHHIISDGVSTGILVEEFSRIYAEDELKPLRIQYKDFSEWQNKLFKSDKIKAQEEYWLKQFEGEIPVLNLTTDYQRPSVQSFEGDTIQFEINKELTNRLRQIVKITGSTMYMVLLSTFNILLSKYSKQEDIVVGSPIAGRPHADLENIIGMFVSTLAMRNYPSGEKTYKEFLREVKENALGAYENQDYQFEELVEKLNVARDFSRNPVFDVMFVLQNMDMRELVVKDIKINPYKTENMISKFDISMNAVELENSISIDIQYCTKLFNKVTIERIFNHLQKIIQVVTENIDIKLSDVDILTEEERQQILIDFNNTKADYPKDKTIHQIFEEQVEQIPNNIAVVFEDKRLTYRELNERANQLARKLRSRGIASDSIVAIMVERSSEMMIGIMGILKAGGAYLPIDPKYPKDRIEYMLQDSETRILLTQSNLYKGMAKDIEVIELDNEAAYQGEKDNLDRESKSNELAYVIYTSGSTGKPKGVMIENRSVINLVYTLKDKIYQNSTSINVALVAPYVFDASVQQIFPSLLLGQSLYIVPEDTRYDGRKLIDYYIKNNIDISDGTPNHIRLITGADNNNWDAIKVKKFIIGGEALSNDIINGFKSKLINGDTEIINVYGPTECCVDSTFYTINKNNVDDIVTIGKPLNNYRIYIVDKHFKLCPIGVPGELCISGEGLARGYLNRLELTAEKFVDNPFEHGTIMYRTGDLARWLTDGNIEFLGRIDHQVKIRGYRIELGEIENKLLSHEAVKETVVIAKDDNSGNKYLCAYIVMDYKLTITELREHLLKALPDYMIPSYFIQLEKLPLTSNGKVDRKTLPEPDYNISTGAEYEAPRNSIEEKLVEIWGEILGVKKIGINDNFFELGGDSIKSIQVSARMQKYQLKLEVKHIMKNPTIKELSRYVVRNIRKAEQGLVSGKIELTPIQSWFFERSITDKHHWNQSVMLYREAGFDEEALIKTFDKLVEHHDILRSIYEEKQGNIRQIGRAKDGDFFTLEIIDLTHIDTKETLEEKIKENANNIQCSIDLSNGPLIKLGLFKTNNGDHLLIVIHHLVVDGLSWRIIFEDLNIAYKQVMNGERIVLQDKTDSFKLWSEELQKYANCSKLIKELPYWRKIEESDIPAIPKDGNINSNTLKDARALSIDFTEKETDELIKQVNRAYGTEINDILLTALGATIKEWSGNEKVKIDLEGHGRELKLSNVDISRTVGWFTSAYPVVIDMTEVENIGYTIKKTKEMLRHIPNKGVGYGILKYITSPGNKEGVSFDRNAEISFNYLGQFDSDINTEVFKASNMPSGNNVSMKSEKAYSIDINGMIVGGKLRLSFSYNKNEYREETIKRILEIYSCKLRKIIEHCIEKEATEITPSDTRAKIMRLEEFDMLIEALEKSGIQQKDLEDIYPLSPMQEGMLFHALLDKSSHAYFEQTTLEIDGELDIDIFEKSLENIIQKHEVLRTVFVYETLEKPVQVVLRKRKANISYEDITQVNKNSKAEYIEKIKNADIETGFDLTKDTLIRAAIIKETERKYQIVWSFHHIIMDGWCLSLIMKDFFESYSAIKAGRAVNIGKSEAYGSFIEWLEEQEKKNDIEYWQKYLYGYEQQATIPLKGVANDREVNKTEKVQFTLNTKLTEGLAKVAQYAGVTLNTIVQAMWGILLQKYNNVEDVVFGAVVSGRPEEIKGIEEIVGLFINTIPVRVRQDKESTFNELIKELQNKSIEASQYDYLELAEIQSNSELKQDLIDHIIVFENYPIEKEVQGLSKENDIGFSIRDVQVYEQTNYDFAVIVTPGKELVIKLTYNTSMYDEEHIRKIERHFTQIAESVVEDTKVKPSEVELLTEAERQQILLDFNNTKADYPMNKTIHQLFEEQVVRTPNNIAVIYEDKSLTYRELNQSANKLAQLLRQKGVSRDSIVGLMIERSLEMEIGILAILKAGGAYLPISPDYPEDRIKYMLEDSEAKVLLTQNRFMDKVDFECRINLEDISIYQGADTNPEYVSTPRDLAYVIYTSGSTGKPKGVMIEHYSVINRINWMQKKYPLDSTDVILQKTNFTFDVSVWELFWWFFAGARVCFLISGGEKDPEAITSAIEKNKVTTMHFVPSMLSVFLDYIDGTIEQERLASLRQVFASGEALNLHQVEDFNHKLWSTNDTKLINLYGPTEATVDVSYFDCSKGGSLKVVPIGKPIDNIELYVVNKNNNLMPIGVTGELCIAGVGLARGYLNRSELTAERFINNPFESGTRMYRTGDLARWLPDGNIEYLGRIDNQIKIRGYRVELGEIENKLLSHEAVKETVVVAKTDNSENKYLCAYVIAERELSISELRNHLSKEIPDYMIPSYFIQLEKLPLTPNGKVDRKALPELDGSIFTGTEYEAPRNSVEETIVEIWREVLGVEKIGINDNFFELGGHSLKATGLAAKIHKLLNVEVPLKEIFTNPTIKGISEYIKGSKESIYSSIELVEEKEYYEMSSAQKRIYTLQQLDLNSTSYNMHGVLELEGDLDVERLKDAFNKLIHKHEALRTSFEIAEEGLIQKVQKKVEFQIEDYEAEENQEIEEIIKSFIRIFDLSKAPLLRVGLVKVHTNKHILMYDMHHIISDGVSMGILVEEFSKAYAGEELTLLRIQYKDFSEWQNGLFRGDSIKMQEEYWLKQFEGDIPVLNFPTDYQRPALQSFEGASIEFEIGIELTKKLRQIAKATGSTMYMVLLSSFNILLSKYSGQEDIIVGSPIAGRPHADLDNIIGMFVNTLAMRNHPSGEKTFKEFLREVKENALGAYENQDYQFEELVEKLNLTRDFSRNPLFDTMFVLQNMDIKEAVAEGIKISLYKAEDRISKFDMTMNAVELENSISIDIQYCTKLFDKVTIERMYRHLENIIQIVTENIDTKLSEVEILTKEEKQQILIDFNNTKTDYPKDKTIHQLFEEQVEKTPDNIAVVCEDKRLTYRELNERANQLARLLRNKGIGADSIVAIMVERSLEMAVGVLGILKAGGAYLPIDPDYKVDRIKYMLQDSHCSILLCKNSTIELELNVDIIPLVDVQTFNKENNNLVNINTPQDLAYIMYTSGSTGKPKGVLIEHRSVVRLVKNTNYIDFGKCSRILQTGALVFDASTFEIWGSLLNGLTLHLVNKEVILDAAKLKNELMRNHIDTIWLTSSLFTQLVSEDASIFKECKNLLVGGDVLSVKHINAVRNECKGINIVNGYGPTENTTFSVCHKIEKDYVDNIPIGRPISSSTAYIVDKNNKLCPIGVAGELCVAGVGLARGYLNSPELTAEKFVNNPFESGTRMYRTGDLARWLADGSIEFLGRLDYQVKIRGFRIELGEIENKLLSYATLKETVVTANTDSSGSKYLCAYVAGEKELTTMELREHLSNNLPDYMIPSYFIQLDKLPLTPNGKVDRKALPKPDYNKSTGAKYEAPRNIIEEKLIDIWREVLGVEKIGINDNFFELGGHSLNAVKIVNLIHKRFNIEVKLNSLFKFPSIMEFSEFLSNSNISQFNEIKPLADQEYYELSYSQKRLWLINQIEPDTNAYNLPVNICINEYVDLVVVEKVLYKLSERHESMRTYFKVIDEIPVQIISKDIAINIKMYDLSTLQEQELRLEKQRIVEELGIPFNLEESPLFRACLLKYEEASFELVGIMHHIISDGWSLDVLGREFNYLYNAFKNNEAVYLEPLKTQYKDFAAWQNQLIVEKEQAKNAKEYWEKQLIGEIPILNLSVCNAFEKSDCMESKGYRAVISSEISNRLKLFAKQSNVSLFTLMIAILNVYLSELTGQQDIMIATAGSGRQHQDLKNVMGYFVNTIILRNQVKPEDSLNDLIKIISSNTMDALEYQYYPIELIVEELKIDYPKISVFFNMLNISQSDNVYLDNLEAYHIDKIQDAKFDIVFYVKEYANGIELLTVYYSNSYSELLIESIIDRYLQLIEQVIDNPNTPLNELGQNQKKKKFKKK